MNANPIQDQIAAATEDARRRVDALGETGDYELGPAGSLGRNIIERWFERSAGVPERMCAHVYQAPQIVYSAPWLPGICTCSDCFTDVMNSRVATYDAMGLGRPCDACGELAYMGKTGVLNFGPVMMVISWCLPCSNKDAEEAANGR